MKRWIWRILLAAAVAAALTGTAMAEEVRYPATGNNSIRYDLTNGVGTVLGPVSKDNIENAQILGEVQGVKITKIADNAFNGCGKLTSVKIESNMEAIGISAFNSCQNLQTVLLPDSVKVIEGYAFANCGRLNKVVLPAILTTIKSGTFANCASLTSIYIASVKSIEADAFSGAAKLKALHCDSPDGLNQTDSPGLPAHRASRIPGLKTDPTCTVEGNQAYTYSCAICGAGFNFSQDHAIPANGHTPGAEIPKVEATCARAGTEAGVRCTVCSSVISGLKPIPADPTKHVAAPVDVPAVEATCTEPGQTAGTICPDCGHYITAPKEVKAKGHTYGATDEREEIITEATCTVKGEKAIFRHCSVCDEDIETDREDIDLAPHEYAGGKTETYNIREATCSSDDNKQGSTAVYKVCDVCGRPNFCETECAALRKALEDAQTAGNSAAIAKAQNDLIDHLKANHQNETSGGYVKLESLDRLDHAKPAPTAENLDHETPADCTTDGERVYKEETKCTACGEALPETDRTEVLKALGHDMTEPTRNEVLQAATCQAEGVMRTGYQECRREGCSEKVPGRLEAIPKTAHTWGNPGPDESKEDKEPACGEAGVRYVTVECSVCHASESQEIEIPATGVHDYGGWTVVKAATATEDGLEKRICDKCKREDTRVIPAAGAADPGTSDPGTSDPGTTDPGTSKPDSGAGHSVTVTSGAGGTATVSKTSAKKGESVTITVSPYSGYEWDRMRIIAGGASDVDYSDQGRNRYRFTMPDANVSVTVSFLRVDFSEDWSGASNGTGGDPTRSKDNTPVQIAPQSVPRASAWGQIFSDIPTSHWAAGEINWANRMGYMNGTEGRFNPDEPITCQQMWMVLARLTGSYPANMADARRWAVEGSFADGSSPTAPVARHQLVTALYRCAHLKGGVNRSNASLAGYADSRIVPAAARDAFAWAVANGIISGTAGNRLEPNGTLTRAQFAVILYRYSQRV